MEIYGTITLTIVINYLLAHPMAGLCFLNTIHSLGSIQMVWQMLMLTIKHKPLIIQKSIMNIAKPIHVGGMAIVIYAGASQQAIFPPGITPTNPTMIRE